MRLRLIRLRLWVTHIVKTNSAPIFRGVGGDGEDGRFFPGQENSLFSTISTFLSSFGSRSPHLLDAARHAGTSTLDHFRHHPYVAGSVAFGTGRTAVRHVGTSRSDRTTVRPGVGGPSGPIPPSSICGRFGHVRHFSGSTPYVHRWDCVGAVLRIADREISPSKIAMRCVRPRGNRTRCHRFRHHTTQCRPVWPNLCSSHRKKN